MVNLPFGGDDSALTWIIQQAIDAATGLNAEFETALRIIEAKDKRIAAMAQVLDNVPHVKGETRCEYYQTGTDEQMHREDCPCNGTGFWCAIGCPRCAWERMKKDNG